jgi:MFS family permease
MLRRMIPGRRCATLVAMANGPASDPVPVRVLAMWALAASTFLYAFLQRVSPSVMVSELMAAFGVGGAVLGNLSAFYLYAYAALQIPLGILFDRFGVRRLMSISLAISALGSLLFAVATSIEPAYVGRMLIGIGVASTWVGALTVAAQWLPASRFAMFAGIAQMLGCLGAIFGQAPLAALVAAIGWRGAVVTMGGIGAAMALAIWLIVRDRSRAGGIGPAPRIADGIRSVVRVRDTWACAVFGFAMTGPMLSFGGLWAVPYLMTVYELPRTTAAAVTSLIFAGWGVGAPTIGWLSDRLGRRKLPMLVCAAIAGALLATVIFGPRLPLWLLGTLLAIHGAAAAAMVLSFALVKERNAPGASSAAMGVVNTFVVGSGALLQPLIGLLLDLGWTGATRDGARVYAPETFTAALAILPLLFVFALLAGASVREVRPSAAR